MTAIGFGLAVPMDRVACQSPGYSIAVQAEVDASSTELGGFLLAIPGVADDFVLLADGACVVRAGGTVRLSAHVHSRAAIDREFFLELEFAGRLAPGDMGYPPAGSPVLTLQPGAYVPLGTVDPTTFVYFTQVSGTLTGLRHYEGARLAVVNVGAAQMGSGASNKNVGSGLAVDLALTVLQPPGYGALVPTAAARLRVTLAPSLSVCMTHVDANAGLSNGPSRAAVAIPGLASDYVFLPVGTWLERADGSAVLAGAIRRQSVHSDAWTCSLLLTGRVDPGDAAYPPAGAPVMQLLPGAYGSQGGPVVPARWRYYTQGVGSLTGSGLNAGGVIHVGVTGAVQVGLGADQGNSYFGLAAALTATAIVQPPAHPIRVTGNLSIRANVATQCILPTPLVISGITQSTASVTQQRLSYVGVDLGWCEQAALGSTIVAAGDVRQWYTGNLRVVDHGTIELSIPQGLPPAVYPLRLLGAGGASNQMTVNVHAPVTPTLRTENDRLIGEPQHWVLHQGNLPLPVFSFLVLSESALPSSSPGIVSLAIGNQFNDILILHGIFHDPVTGLGMGFVPAIPFRMAGRRVLAQAAMLSSAGFPLFASDTWLTYY